MAGFASAHIILACCLRQVKCLRILKVEAYILEAYTIAHFNLDRKILH